jgi:adenylate cyclase
MTPAIQKINPTPSSDHILTVWKNPRKYSVPSEQERIFLFIDMNESTPLAEQLGHVKYSMLLSEFFSDFNECLQETSGEIYQYVGDEVIVSWDLSRPNIETALNLVRRFTSLLRSKEQWYQDIFLHTPTFKAALHAGTVATTTIGNIKTYHGDVLNTCARMIEVASTLKFPILASETIMRNLSFNNNAPLPLTAMRGKKNQVLLFAVPEVD